jgi:hypothetical protein
MDGNVAESQLSPASALPGHSALHFELATAEHDPAIRRLLRENPFAGNISISLQTEPDYFAATDLLGPSHYTIVATEHERLVCVGTVSVRKRFINGNPTDVGYLSGLRLDRSCRNKFSIIRRGYRFFHELHQNDGPELYLTSVISDNMVARRLLERNLPGMPTYRHLEDFITLVIPVVSRMRRGLATTGSSEEVKLRRGTNTDIQAIVSLLNVCNRNYRFAIVWREEDLTSANDVYGLHPSDFCLSFHGGELVACAAVWDQRAFKQTVIAGYSTRLRCLRRCSNFLPWMPQLPEVGETLAQAFISPVAAKAGYERFLPAIIQRLLFEAQRMGLEYVVAGFAARDPRGMVIRKHFSAKRYSSRLYVVSWPDAHSDSGVLTLDDEIASPEVALL